MILASGSATRALLLRNAGLDFEVQPADIDERALEGRLGADAGTVALMLAAAKAEVVSDLKPKALVIGADQTMVLDGRRFHKPFSRGMAREQMMVLAGRTHSLWSAVAAARHGRTVFHHVEEARLTMRPFGDVEADAYLDLVGEAAFKSVGGYQVEGPGLRLFEKIDGDWFTILGLPLLPLLGFLRDSKEIAW